MVMERAEVGHDGELQGATRLEDLEVTTAIPPSPMGEVDHRYGRPKELHKGGPLARQASRAAAEMGCPASLKLGREERGE
jgi:hypothetical protein